MCCDFFIILRLGLNFDTICLCFNAVLAMGHLWRQIAWKKSCGRCSGAFSSFSAQQLTSLTIIQQLKLLGQKHKLWAVVCNSWFHHHCQSQPDILANKPATEPSCLLHWLTGFNNRKSTRQHIKSADVYAHKAWEIKSAYHCTYRQISI